MPRRAEQVLTAAPPEAAGHGTKGIFYSHIPILIGVVLTHRRRPLARRAGGCARMGM
ncbi:MAG TPA: hypothetical protein VLW50_07145 [Streptosporangiaceae bacterium]|nr:hypothetical protein [Streptosporangiaceae bacterium]